MEIPLMSTITGLEAGISSLENPSIPSRLFRLSGIAEASEIFGFWTWGAIILASIATFSSILHRTKIVFIKLREKGKSVISETLAGSDYDSDDETSCSSLSESSDDEEEEEEEEEPSAWESGIGKNFRGEEDFTVKGGRDRFKFKSSWPLANVGDGRSASGSIVKFWDDFAFGFDNSAGLISMLDLNKGEIIRSFLSGGGQSPALCFPSPSVVVSAGVENMRQAALRVWDARVGGGLPSIVAEWQPRWRQVVGVDSDGEKKVYVREGDGSSAAVRDLRSAATPLEEIAKGDAQTWFDADAVMVGEGDGDSDWVDAVLTEGDGSESSSTTRRRNANAVRPCLF
ncbi:hypothetical protein ACLOJK_001310 [Asimina triloba]